jgi:hypothetical protein
MMAAEKSHVGTEGRGKRGCYFERRPALMDFKFQISNLEFEI